MADLRYVVLLVLATAQASLGNEPMLTILPDNILKAVGNGVYVSCTAKVDDAALVTEMSWTAPDGRKIINNVDDTVSTAEDGTEAKLDLIINTLREQDVGEYTCSATYAGNQNLEAKVMVQSYMEIDFGDTPTHQTLLIGEEGKVKCTPKARPSPEVDWFKNRVALKNDDSHIIQQDGILITEVTEADEGTYRCRARVQQLGSIKQVNIQVEVYIPPTIDQPPQDLQGKETESVKFECGATGKPAPEYTWVDKDNRPLEDLEGYHVDSETGDLTILDLKPEQSGEYRCTASNSAGEDFKTANLQVLTKPRVEEFKNLTLAADGLAELRCVVTGSPKPLVVFKKESEPSDFVSGFNADDRISVAQETDEEGREVGILKIRNVARSDDGLYTCTAQSDGGVTQRWGHITVEFKPTFEDQGPTVQWSWEKAAVNLTCLATSIPNATVQWYLRNQEIDFNDPNLERISLGPVGVLKVTPASSSYFGSYTCEATNTLGTATLDLELKEAHAPGPIASAKVEKKTATTLTWSLVDPADNGGLPIQGYIVQYRDRDQSWEGATTAKWTKGSSYTIDNLIPQTTYVFRFAARSKAGDGEWGGEKSEEMPRHAQPEEPLIFAATDRVVAIPYPSHYDLQWQVPLDNGKEIDHFQIVYYQVKEKAGKWEAVGDKTTQEVKYPGTTTYKIEGLHVNSHYKIELRAHNDIGFSTPAEAIIKTANGPQPDTAAQQDGPGTGIIVAIIVIVLVVVLVVVDVSCFFTRNAGLTATIAGKRGSKDKDKEAMLEDGKNASEDIQEGNGQMKTPKEDDLKPEPEEDSNKKVKESTEPTETTPMIQTISRHSLQGTAIPRQEALPLRAASQSRMLEKSEDSEKQFSRNQFTKSPLLNPAGTEATRPTNPVILELLRKDGSKESALLFSASPKINEHLRMSHHLSDEDSLYAKPTNVDAANTSSPLYPTRPPPLPSRNIGTHQPQLTRSQEILSDAPALRIKEPVTRERLQSLQIVPGSPEELNTLAALQYSSASCDMLSQAPQNVNDNFGSRNVLRLGREEPTSRIKPQPHPRARNREVLNQQSPFAYDRSKYLPEPRAKKVLMETSPKSGYASGNSKVPNPKEPKFRADRLPKTPSISSNSTLYQPADAGYQYYPTRTAYKIAPYDDPGCQVGASPSPSHRASKGLEMPPVKAKGSNRIAPVPGVRTPRAAFVRHVTAREEKKSPRTVTELLTQDAPLHLSHSRSMDQLDGPVDAQWPFSTQPSPDHKLPMMSTAKSLNSLLDSSSMRSYGQPTLL